MIFEGHSTSSTMVLADKACKKKKKKKKIDLHRQRGPLRGSSSPLRRFKLARIKPIKLAYDPRRPDGRPHSGQRL